MEQQFEYIALDTIRALQMPRQSSEAANVALSGVREAGYDYLLYCCILIDQEDNLCIRTRIEKPHAAICPDEYYKRYTKLREKEPDPLIHHVWLHGQPSTLCEFKKQNAGSNSFIFAEAEDAGIRSQLLIPTSISGNRMSLVTLLGREGDPQPNIQSHLQLMAVALAQNIDSSKSAQEKAASSNYRLTPREGDCLALLANGATTTQISEDLSISERTVQFHIDHAKEKLGATTRVEAAVKALKQKLISID